MVISVVLMIIAQICIFTYVGGYRVVSGVFCCCFSIVHICVHSQGLHQILGSIAFTFALLNPIGAFFRPHPGTSNRWLFNWGHWLGGNVGHIAAVAAILVAFRLKAANLTDSFIFVVIAWILFHVVTHLVFQIHQSCANTRRKY